MKCDSITKHHLFLWQNKNKSLVSKHGNTNRKEDLQRFQAHHITGTLQVNYYCFAMKIIIIDFTLIIYLIQKMVKLCPRSCWMTPFLNLAVGFGEQNIIFHVKHVTTLQMLKKTRLSHRFSPKFKENAQWRMGTKPNTLMAWRSVDWYQKRLISNQCLEFCTVVIR